METYKKIQGFENYSVSDFGNVRNDKTCHRNGYDMVRLRKEKWTYKNDIHRLVAITFLTNPENKNVLTTLITIDKIITLSNYVLLHIHKIVKINQWAKRIQVELKECAGIRKRINGQHK